MKKKVVLATGNSRKVAEMSAILANCNLHIIPQSDFSIGDITETGLSFVENAILKARHASNIAGLPVIADDSGLLVSALNGKPGLYSARYAGKHGDDRANRLKLLSELITIPTAQRAAKFVCCIVYLSSANDENPIIAQGECIGLISQEERGNNGFGYDSIFIPQGKKKTFAELENKNEISHRAKALAILQEKLSTTLIL